VIEVAGTGLKKPAAAKIRFKFALADCDE